MTNSLKEPLFSFGVISDIQYADIDSRENFQKTRWRHYRESLNVLKQAVHYWNSMEAENKVSFVLQLGDIIDGFNILDNSSQMSLDKVLKVFAAFTGPIHHILGNHDLYNFKRNVLLQSDLNSSPYKNNQSVKERKAYYDFYPHEMFCIIVLDTYEISVHGYEEGHPIRTYSEAILASVNPNEDKNSSSGMHGISRRFVSYNAAVSDEQLQWLDMILTAAQERKQWVIISGHQPIYQQASIDNTVCWNYDEILAVLHKHSCVVAYLAGHDHNGGYAMDDHGIHHVTFHGAVEGDVGKIDIGTVHVYGNRLELMGQGRIPDRILNFQNACPPGK